jgi:hypothetical protein
MAANLISAIRQGAPDTSKCQICFSSTELFLIEFGLGKFQASRRWDRVFGSALISAVSLPLCGLGFIALPTKKTNLEIVRLKLVLCSRCWTSQRNLDFRAHPWFQPLWNSGYHQFIPPEKLDFFLQ